MNEVDKALREKRDPFVAHLSGMAEVIFPYDRMYGRILGGYTEDQRKAFYQVSASYAGMKYYGETVAESACRDILTLLGTLEATTEGRTRLLRKLKR